MAVVWADSRSGGSFGAWAADVLQGMVDVGRTATDHVGFGVQARRRVVERPCAWVLKCRRVVRDYEELVATTEAWI
jgi:transposase